MNYLSEIKVSGIQNLTDGRYAAGIWAQWAGFCFDPENKACINILKAAEIRGWINGPNITGEFAYPSIDEIRDIAQMMRLETIQIPSDYPDASIKSLEIDLILEYKKDAVNTELLSELTFWLVKNEADYKKLSDEGYIYIILQKESFVIEEVIALEPYGIGLIGQPEEAAGIRDYEKWNELLEAIAID
ncbi:MAG: hypothetical protein H7321_00290 [Bacteroidia bacterium]|nr:hypothetical protein [Bacteroidia bacterium]